MKSLPIIVAIHALILFVGCKNEKQSTTVSSTPSTSQTPNDCKNCATALWFYDMAEQAILCPPSHEVLSTDPQKPIEQIEAIAEKRIGTIQKAFCTVSCTAEQGGQQELKLKIIGAVIDDPKNPSGRIRVGAQADINPLKEVCQ